jgi:NAD-dependent SIR2 family protein deacetylase
MKRAMKRSRQTLSSLELGVEAVVAFARDCFATKVSVVIVGAGISTAQGVPDYRSPGGLFDELTALLLSRFNMTGPSVVSDALSVNTYKLRPEVFPNRHRAHLL